MYKMRMGYFDGIRFGFGDHVPACNAWIERDFPANCALNFVAAGRVLWKRPDGRMLELPAPAAWWTWPGPRFVYGRRPGETWDHYYITFHGPRVRRMISAGLLRCDPATAFAAVADPHRFRQNFERLLTCIRQPVPQTDLATNLLEGMLLSLQHATAPAVSPVVQEVEALAAEIRQHPAAEWNLAVAADRVGVSSPHLRRLFRQVIGLPIHQYLIRVRLEHGAHLLRSAELPIKAVAAACGYPDVLHFTKAFRRHAAMPPAAYRREYRRMTGENP